MTEEDYNVNYKRLIVDLKKLDGASFLNNKGGFRLETNIPKNHVYVLEHKHDEKFLQKTYASTDSNCVWLAAAMIINETSPETADVMINHLKDMPLTYDWLYLVKKKRHLKDKSKSLQQLLQQSTKFELRKVDCQGGDYLQMFLNGTLKSRYIVKLEDDERNNFLVYHFHPYHTLTYHVVPHLYILDCFL
mgnify:CR=1 FL=1